MSSRAVSRLASIIPGLRPALSTPIIQQQPQQQFIKPIINTARAFAATSSKPKHKSSAMESSIHPLKGLHKPNPLKGLYYGPNIVQEHLLDCLPTEKSKAFIITGNSLATKTPLIKQLEDLLKSRSAHAGTFSNIKQHAPVADLDEATNQVLSDNTIDTIISVGGGSPIDSTKAISYRCNEKNGSFLLHIAIPTTLSAAECTFIAGYTQDDGVKTSVVHPATYPSYVFYDSKFGLQTPPHLFMSTGIRALDHAVELQYYPTATIVPTHYVTVLAIEQLFKYLPQYKENPKDEDIIIRLFLAAYASLGYLGANLKGGLGMSHTLGYALGSPYGIPHGITSCMTLGHVVKLKASTSKEDAASIAKLLPVLPGAEQRSGDDVKDANKVGDHILKLVEDLGFKTTLTEKGVGKDQLDIIVKRATGGQLSDEMTAKVKNLVENLY